MGAHLVYFAYLIISIPMTLNELYLNLLWVWSRALLWRSIIILINFSMAYAKLIKIMMLTAACYIIWIYSHSYFNSYILCLSLILGLHEDKTTHNVNDIKWSKDANLVKEKYVSLLFLFNAPLLQNGILYEYFTTWHYASFSRACQMCKILVI